MHAQEIDQPSSPYALRSVPAVAVSAPPPPYSERGPAYYVFGFPVALTAAIERFCRRAPQREWHRLLFLAATGLLGAAGLRLVVSTQGKSLRLRAAAWFLAWPLCLLGHGWLVLATVGLRGAPFLVLVPPAVVTLIHWAFDRGAPPGLKRRGFRMATAFAGGPGLRLFFGIRAHRWLRFPSRVLGWLLLFVAAAWFLIAGWPTLLEIPAVVGAPVIALENLRRLLQRADPAKGVVRFARATLGAGPRGIAHYRNAASRPSWQRVPRHTLGLLLCTAGLLAFTALGWLAFLRTPPGKRFAVNLPFLPVFLLEWTFRKTAGFDWYRPGFNLATLFLGAAVLRLRRCPPRRWWLRFPAYAATLVLTAGALAWFAYCGKWALLLVPLLRQGRHLRAAPLYDREPEWAGQRMGFRLERLDYLSLGIVGVVFLLLLAAHNNLMPFAPDGYYHLLVAQHIVDTGRIPLWDSWEYAPAGRPHLYPPLIHVLIALCSLPFGGNVVDGMRVLQILILPLAQLSAWYMVRRLFDAPRAFLTILVLGTDFFFPFAALMALPSILANVFEPLLLVTFLTKRFWATVALIALSLYAHLGVAPLVLLSLLLFSLLERRYLLFFLTTAAAGILLAVPWYGHIWLNRDWLGHPMRDVVPAWQAALFKPFWLLMVNVVILLLAFRGMSLVRWRDSRNRLFAAVLVGFLPMFISYGGRYFAHTAPFWAALAAVPLAPLLYGTFRRQFVPVAVLLAFFPTLMFSGPGGMGGLPGLHPMISGWTLLPAVALGGGKALGDNKQEPNGPTPEIMDLADYIRRNTAPDQILHAGNHVDLALMAGFHSQRRIDTAAWPETRKSNTAPDAAAYAKTDPTGCYIASKSEDIPKGLTSHRVGDYYVAIRSASP